MQVAVGHDYVAHVQQHSSQKDAAKGFGGKFGVEKDRLDKVRGQEGLCFIFIHSTSRRRLLCLGFIHITLPLNAIHTLFVQSAVGFEYKGEVKQHTSQKGWSNRIILSH